MDKLSKAASVIGIKEVDDEMFDEIENSSTIKNLEVKVMQCCLYCGLFGFLFVTFGLVAHFGYDNKDHLAFLGLISTLHVIGLLIGFMGVKKKIRYVMIAMALMNVAWISLVSLLIVFCLYMLRNKAMKDEFNNEIIFHVGLLVYYPLTIVYAMYHLLLVQNLYTLKTKRNSQYEDVSVTETSVTSEASSQISESTKNIDLEKSAPNTSGESSTIKGKGRKTSAKASK